MMNGFVPDKAELLSQAIPWFDDQASRMIGIGHADGATAAIHEDDHETT